MISKKAFIILFISFNFLNCLITLEEKYQNSSDSPTKYLTFKEFDRIMSNSKFHKAWKKFRNTVENGEDEDTYEENNEDINFEDDINKATFSELNDEPSSCLLSKEETKEIIKNKLGIEDDNPSDEARFIFGKCNPIILVPGMLSTKLQIKINCKKLVEEEYPIYKKLRFYCGENPCASNKTESEEQSFFISALEDFGIASIVEDESRNKYSACLGYFLTFFNSKKACASYDEKNDEYVCNYSKNIKIGYYGFISKSKDKGKCGLNAIQNVVLLPEGLDDVAKQINTGILRSLGPLIDRLESKGYKAGFSLAGIPNDYRYFLSNNKFTLDAFRYQVEKLYENTGKKVVLMGHSFGTITIYNSLINKKNEDILPKIKKFVAVGPTFAGSSQLVDIFFKSGERYSRTIDYEGEKIKAGVDEFGFGFIINSIPTVFELRPLPILGNLFTKPGYEIFSDAIKERFFLEKKCGYKQCDEYLINKYSTKFNALFKDYFPLLTDDDCQFEPDLKNPYNYFNRKCLMQMRNIYDCPMIIEETKDKNGKLPSDFDSYCGRIEPNLFYQKDCDNSDKQCMDQLYSKYVQYPFEESSEKLQWFKKRWDEEYKGYLGEYESYFVIPEEKYKTMTQKQIDFYEKNSITKDLPVPTVDTDIVFSTYEPTVAAFIFDKDDWHNNINELRKGGDGVVPNWSAIIPGLKWIFDNKKYNLKTNIRLVEFCSRLGKNSKYTYDPLNEDQKFVALSCECINNNNLYEQKDCSHTMMISDSFFYDYFDSIIDDPKDNNEITFDKISAYNNFNGALNYENQCNIDYLKILENSMQNDMSYSDEDYDYK